MSDSKKRNYSKLKYVAIIVTIILAGLVTMQHIENQKLKAQLVGYEKEQWYRLHRMTEYVVDFQINSEFSDEYNDHMYVNQICHSFLSNYDMSRLLRETYDPLHLELSIIEEGPAKDAALELLGEMNTYIMNVSNSSRIALIEGEIYEAEDLEDMKNYFAEKVYKYFKTYD